MTTDAMTICRLCGSRTWFPLPEPSAGRSVTTSGKIVAEPLGKAQCETCGLVQRVQSKSNDNVRYYEEEYDTYFERVGAEAYDAGRYRATAEWIRAAVSALEPSRIVDVGCGRGWQMREMGRVFPGSAISGIEPSRRDADVAAEAGFSVTNAMLGDVASSFAEMDLVYSNNVIQHTSEPLQFLRDLRAMVRSRGLIVITCPDATIPGNEMMWSDQRFSFAPEHLFRLAREAGLSVIAWKAPPDVGALKDKQLVVLAREGDGRESAWSAPPPLDVGANIVVRERYTRAWASLDGEICRMQDGRGRTYNFGASMWSYLLRGYCPSYWSAVEACLVDSFSGRFMDRDVLPMESASLADRDNLVLGINPSSQPAMKERLRHAPFNVVTWNSLIRG